jgi:molybdopterin-guanine dinucleotide biosynthesis protein A
VVPIVAGEVQGLCALYRREVRAQIDELLRTDQRSVRALLRGI